MPPVTVTGRSTRNPELALLHAHRDREAAVELEVSELREPQRRELGAHAGPRSGTRRSGAARRGARAAACSSTRPPRAGGSTGSRERPRARASAAEVKIRPGRLVDVPLRVVELRVREREHAVAPRSRRGSDPARRSRGSRRPDSPQPRDSSPTRDSRPRRGAPRATVLPRGAARSRSPRTGAPACRGARRARPARGCRPPGARPRRASRRADRVIGAAPPARSACARAVLRLAAGHEHDLGARRPRSPRTRARTASSGARRSRRAACARASRFTRSATQPRGIGIAPEAARHRDRVGALEPAPRARVVGRALERARHQRHGLERARGIALALRRPRRRRSTPECARSSLTLARVDLLQRAHADRLALERADRARARARRRDAW